MFGGTGSDVWNSENGTTWTQVTSTAAWPALGSALVYDNKMWILGGASGTYYNHVWNSTDGITWTQVTSSAAWAARDSFSALAYNNKMWIMGEMRAVPIKTTSGIQRTA